MFEEGFWLLHPSPFQLKLAVVLCFGLFLSGFGIEWLRRYRESRLRLASAWRAAKALMKERGLSEREIHFLEAFLEIHAPDNPLEALTSRQTFNACVEEDMADVLVINDEGRFREQGEILRGIRLAMGLGYVPVGQRIHSTRELHEHQVLWIAPPGSVKDVWRRAVVEGVNEAYLHVKPAKEGATFSPVPGDALRLRLWREEDARYLFQTEFVETEQHGKRWVLRHTAELKRMQARAHFRITYDLTTMAGVINMPADGNMADVYAREAVGSVRGRFTSLSVGGFSLVVNQPISKQILLRVKLELGKGADLAAVGRIVGVSTLPAGQYLVRAAFVSMPEKERDTLNHYVVHKQKLREILDAGADIIPE